MSPTPRQSHHRDSKSNPRATDAVSVIVPTLFEEEQLGTLLCDLRRQSRPPREVIVVDGGSEDETLAVARRSGVPGLRVEVSPRPGTAHQRNLGARLANCETLVFLDADVGLPVDFLESFLASARSRRLRVACPLYLPRYSDLGLRAAHLLFGGLLWILQRVAPIGAGGCLAVRRDAFLESGGFSPELKFEDAELVRRLARMERFGVVGTPVYVSDRRYRSVGRLRLAGAYLMAGPLFIIGRYGLAGRLVQLAESRGSTRR